MIFSYIRKQIEWYKQDGLTSIAEGICNERIVDELQKILDQFSWKPFPETAPKDRDIIVSGFDNYLNRRVYEIVRWRDNLEWYPCIGWLNRFNEALDLTSIIIKWDYWAEVPEYVE